MRAVFELSNRSNIEPKSNYGHNLSDMKHTLATFSPFKKKELIWAPIFQTAFFFLKSSFEIGQLNKDFSLSFFFSEKVTSLWKHSETRNFSAISTTPNLQLTTWLRVIPSFTVNKIKMVTFMCMDVIKLHSMFCCVFMHQQHTSWPWPFPASHTQ